MALRQPNRAAPLPERIDEKAAIRALQIISRQLVARGRIAFVAQMVLNGCSLEELERHAFLTDTVDSDQLADRPVSVAAAGVAGGKARAKALSPERRKQIAKKAAIARWRKQRSQGEFPG